MASTVQLRPNALTVSTGSHSTFGSPPSYVSAVSDNNDGTSIYFIGSGGEIAFGFPDYTLAGDQRCAGMRLIHRLRGTGYGDFSLDTWLRPPGHGDGGGGWYYGADLPNFTTFWNPWYVTEFGQAAVNGVVGHYRNNPPGITTATLSESYLELDIRTRPTVSVTGPAWNSRPFSRRPSVTWNYDSKGDSVREHQVKVFLASVVEGGGFNPDSSSAVWTSQPGGAANSATVGVDLSYGQAYYYYVRLATDFLGGSWWSTWSSTRFIINSPAYPSAITVTPTSPITTTNRPTIGWTFNDTDGDAQEHYYIRVFPESVYSAGGFSPNTDVGTAWNSGTVADSAARSAQTGALSPNVNYKAYVYVTDMGSGTRWSDPVASSVFVIQTAPGVIFDPPATPEVVTVTTDQDQQRLAVTFQGRGNMLTRNQASGDTGNLGMEPDANLSAANLVRDTTTTLQGGGAWKATPTVNGTTMSFRTTRTSSRGPFPVIAGRTYTALGSSRSASTARSSKLLIRWYDAAAALLSTTTGSAANDSSSAWTPYSVTDVAPANAVWAEVVAQNVTPSEAHFWENFSFAPGSSTTWTRGGLALELGALADSFNRADNASSLGTADVGGAWSALVGTWGISGNRAYLSSVTSNAFAVLTSGYLADGYVEADITLSSTTNRANTGLVFRCLDSANLLMVELINISGNDSMTLYKRVANTWTQLATVTSIGNVSGTTYRIRVEFYGGQIYVYRNGVQRISYLMLAGELNQFGAYGKYGLRIDASASTDDNGSRIDNFAAGLLPTQRITLERSLDAGTTWEQVRNAVSLQPSDQQAIVYDYEVPSGVLAQYRARATASEAGNEVLSGYSASVAQSVALTIDTWWLKDAVDPALNMRIKVAPPFAFTRKEVMSTFDPVGREESVFVSDGAKGIEGTLNVWCHDATVYDQLEAILGNGRALLLQDPLGRSWWVKFGAQDWELIRAQPQLTESTPIRHFHGLSLPFVQVGAPAVI